MTKEQAIAMLEAADVFYGPDDEDEDSARTLNMNDTFGWAVGFGDFVPEHKLLEVADLFRRYGRAGLIYWTSERYEQMRSEFEDVNRAIAFVRQEEKVRRDVPDSSKRAYHKHSYTLGLP